MGNTEVTQPRERRFASQHDLDEFVAMLESYERGEVTPDDWKRFRLARGIYGQRQTDVQMIRIKIPQGILGPRQMERIADITDRYSRGFCHITTRQNIQVHFVQLVDCPRAMAELAAVGLTTREACGNTVRNVTCCEKAGVCPTEPFDVTPYGEAVTRYFLRREPFFDLPRKFKIALSGCPQDCAQAGIHDIGLIARVRDGVPGFRMLVGGGLSTQPQAAQVLEEFVPSDELLTRCEAVLSVFWRHGNRKNKSRARMKYVISTKGWEFFVDEYRKELAAICAKSGGKVPIDTLASLAPEAPSGLAPARAGDLPPPAWLASNVRPQKQDGYHIVTIRLRRGDITSAQLRGLARSCVSHGDGTLRTQANDQNVVVRWVPTAHLSALYGDLITLGLQDAGAATVADTTSCPGAESCQLAYTHSRDLALEISERLENANGHAAAVKAAGSASVKISGCPNSCGRHHIATIGWHGGVKRVGQGVVPVYQLHLGGGVDANGAHFGRQIVKIPARRVADAVLRLIDLYAKQRTPDETTDAFFQRVSEEDVKSTLADLAQIDEGTVGLADFIDLGQQEALKVEMGPGECAS